MGRYQEALIDCNSAATTNESKLNSLVSKIRGQIYMKLEKFKEAVDEYIFLVRLFNSSGNQLLELFDLVDFVKLFS